MCIIYNDGDGTVILDLGEDKDGSVVSFAEGFAWFTYEGETMKLPTEVIEQIIS